MIDTFEFTLGSALIAGERTGEGRAVVFLHAGVADRRMWAPQMAGLGEGIAGISYDARGFGATVATDEPFSHSEDLKELLDHFEISVASLVGCSMGGGIAIDFALAWPERVESLVLLAPAISGAPEPQALSDDIQALIRSLDDAESEGDLQRINEIEANIWLDGPSSSPTRVGSSLRQLFLDMNGIALAMPELSMERRPPPAYERLANLAAPTLVLWGELDFPHIKERAQELVGFVDGASGQEIAETAHLPTLEKPELVNRLLLTFLRQQ